MNYEIEKNKVVLHPVGDVDIITAEDFKAECYRILQDNALPFEFDCSKVEFIDSTGLGAFVAVHKRAVEKDLSVSLTHLKPTIKKLFTITRLNEVMKIEEDAR